MDQQLINSQYQRRLIWASVRAQLEADNFKHRKYGEKRKRHWSLFEVLIHIFGSLLKVTPLYRIGTKNASSIVLKRIELEFPDLPEPFHGYTVLHLTDLHIDFIPGMEQVIGELLSGIDADVCTITGDFRERISGGFKSIIKPIRDIVGNMNTRDGIVATLGNHDSYQMVDPFEKMGIRVLANETIDVRRGGERILITGLDDPYYYYTDQAVRALEETPDAFKIALVHAPSMFDAASENGYRLYLCGHTHGGQICLPGGIPIILHIRYGRQFYRGLWHYNGMTGYTGQGTGTVGIPLRFNTRNEITLFTLRRGST
ncbi:hypothetical protein D3OALGA1CA_2674 [Olavius algarvensis associated proteobacterium Delta 3]|nr:hypothetical protein D3OALGB2SA_2624 [Olavius algarvensis associated proteobacterium Delta 3]CAB5122618.1 hypothetical protein D3OALGA1CA_2674 [Olavius algarvensis associated proteobacterium Delta 3]